MLNARPRLLHSSVSLEPQPPGDPLTRAWHHLRRARAELAKGRTLARSGDPRAALVLARGNAEARLALGLVGGGEPHR